MDTQTGRVLAMSGGWAYGRSQFNRAVQAARQPGSAFKPFVYLAAMDAGFTPARIVLDAPFVYDPGYGQPLWTPKNYGGDMLGPTTVRRGLELSRNLMTVRMAQQVGMKKRRRRRQATSASPTTCGAYLPMALGAGETTLAAHDHGLRDAGQRRAARSRRRWSTACRTATARRSTATSRAPAAVAASRRAARSRPRRELVDRRKPFHDPASVYQVVSMMQGVTTRGTAGRLAALGRPIAGKTGTTNDAHDNWFLAPRPTSPSASISASTSRAPWARRRPVAATPCRSTKRSPRRFSRASRRRRSACRRGLRMVRFSYEGGTIDEVFKPGTEPGSEGYMVTPLDGSAPYSAADPTAGPQQAGGPRRPGLSGTGETY